MRGRDRRPACLRMSVGTAGCARSASSAAEPLDMQPVEVAELCRMARRAVRPGLRRRGLLAASAGTDQGLASAGASDLQIGAETRSGRAIIPRAMANLVRPATEWMFSLFMMRSR